MVKFLIRRGGLASWGSAALLGIALLFPGERAFAQFATSTFTSNYSGAYIGTRVSYTNVSIARKYRVADSTTDQGFVYGAAPISLAGVVGYRYNAYIGAEATVYFPVSGPSAGFTTDGTPVQRTAAPANYKTSGTNNIFTTTENATKNYGLAYSVSLVGSYPLSSEFSVYVKLGVGGATAPGGESVAFEDNTASGVLTEIDLSKGVVPVGFSFGAGLSFRAGRNFLLAAEFEQTVLGGPGSLDASSVGMNNISLSAAFTF